MWKLNLIASSADLKELNWPINNNNTKMQTKLLIASLAAITDLGRAQAIAPTTTDGVTREVHR